MVKMIEIGELRLPEPPADAGLGPAVAVAAAAALTLVLTTGVNGWLTGHCVVEPGFVMTVPCMREAIAAGCTLMYVLQLSRGAAPETEFGVAATATRRMTLLGFGAEDVLLIDLVVDDEDEDEVGVRRRCWMRGSSPEYVEDISPQCVNAPRLSVNQSEL